jgi:CheY-like chemotaxis protein
MPDMTGIDLSRKLMSLGSIPILLATGNYDQKNIEEAQMAGICSIIEKPFTTEELRKKLYAIFQNQL